MIWRPRLNAIEFCWLGRLSPLQNRLQFSVVSILLSPVSWPSFCWDCKFEKLQAAMLDLFPARPSWTQIISAGFTPFEVIDNESVAPRLVKSIEIWKIWGATPSYKIVYASFALQLSLPSSWINMRTRRQVSKLRPGFAVKICPRPVPSAFGNLTPQFASYQIRPLKMNPPVAPGHSRFIRSIRERLPLKLYRLGRRYSWLNFRTSRRKSYAVPESLASRPERKHPGRCRAVRAVARDIVWERGRGKGYLLVGNPL